MRQSAPGQAGSDRSGGRGVAGERPPDAPDEATALRRGLRLRRVGSSATILVVRLG